MTFCKHCSGVLSANHVCHGNGSVMDEIERLRAEVERLRGLIAAFCAEHSWAAPAWKAQKEIKALFDEMQKM